jgi:hypothetical protein
VSDELEIDGGVDDVLDHAGEQAERDVAEHVPPSFAAVVARARRIDPRSVPQAALERAELHGRAAQRRHDTDLRDDVGALAPFVAQARLDAEHDIAEREYSGVPPLQRGASRSARVRAWSLVGGVMAAAAATVLALGLVDGWRATHDQDAMPRTQSLAGVDTTPDVYEAVPGEEPAVEPASVPRRAVPERVAELPEPASFAPAELPAVSSLMDRIDAPSALPPSTGPRAASSKVPREPTLRQLDARAQAALAAGDRELADRLYAQIITRGQQQPLVELAYAERFSLARARGVAQQRVLWRAYLQAFPRGRFADDADAGLCRTAPAQDKARCWGAYAEQFPTGAYRDHAERWVARGDDPPR